MKVLTIVLFSIALASSCKEGSSALQIDSGIFIDKDRKNSVPAVMWIGMCTATAVSHNTLITAAHCVVENGRVAPQLCIKSGTMANGKCSIKLNVPDEYARGDATGLQSGPYMARDIAIAIFEDQTFSDYFEVYSLLPSPGNQVLLVGYSKARIPNGSEGRGSKRWGKNQIVNVNEDSRTTILSQFRGSADGVAVSPGDSGGPLFINCQIAGVASRMGGGGSGKVSLHTNIIGDNREYLKSLESNGAYYCGLSGSDPQKCPAAGLAMPVANTNDRDEFPCSAENSGAGDVPIGEVYVAISPDQNSSSPLFLSFTQKVDEVVVCQKNNFAECTNSELAVVFTKQIADRYIYAATSLVNLTNTDNVFVVKAKSQGRSLVARLVNIIKN